MTESAMQTMFRDWIKINPPSTSEVYELKISRNPSLPFDSLQEHQAKALLDAKKGLFHKLTDPPVFYGGQMRFNVPRPFDCMFLTNIEGFVIIWFYKPRTPKVFYKIPIKVFLHERDISDRKSITEQKTRELGQPIYIKHGK